MGCIYEIVTKVNEAYKHYHHHKMFEQCKKCVHYKDMDLEDGICATCFYAGNYPKYETKERLPS